MLAAIVLLTSLQSGMGPILPPLSSPDVHRAFQIVAEHTEKGQFDQAKAKLKLLPHFAVTYVWDDSKLPANLRAEWIKVRDEAFRSVTNRVPGLTIKRSANPAIKFSFEKSLATDPASGLPRGIALFYSEVPTETRMEAVIGIERGNPTEKTSAISLHNEIVYALGSYLGLNSGPYLGSMMGRSNLQMQFQSNPDPNELNAITMIQDAVRKITTAVEKKQALKPAIPSASFDPANIERGPVIQGTPIEFSVQVTNLGNATLQFKVVPDCGCMTASPAPAIAPGTSVAVPVKIDTKEIVGDFNKHIMLFSNDSEKPLQIFPIHVRTIPRYRFLTNEPSVLIIDNKSLDTEFFMASPAKQPLEITSVEVQGNPGTATFEPWSGTMADPALNEPAQPREGYRIKVNLGEPQVNGRSAATVVIKTSDPKFPLLRYVIFAQKGIAAMPASIFFGELGKAEREASFILTRPNKPFKIQKIDSDSSFVDAVAVPINGEAEYKVKCTYSGKAPIGDFRATLTIHTNDSKQPLIRVPVMGIVK
jgi:hypothetical protein